MSRIKQIETHYNPTNKKYYTHYKDDAAELLDGDFSEKNIKKVEEQLIFEYSEINPFDRMPYLKGIPNEITDIFIKNKREMYFELHKNIIKDAVRDFGRTEEEKSFNNRELTIEIDNIKIDNQRKYLELVIKELQSQLKDSVLGSVRKLIKKEKSPRIIEVLEHTVNKVSDNFDINFEEDFGALNLILKENLNTMVEDFEKKREMLQNMLNNNDITEEDRTEITNDIKSIEQLLFILPGSIEKLKNSFKNSISSTDSRLIHQKLEHIFKITKIEMNDFKENDSSFEALMGLNGYVVQLCKFEQLLNKEDARISTNYFNIKHYSQQPENKNESFNQKIDSRLFYNSYSFIDGWTMEELFNVRLKRTKYKNASKLKGIEPADWDRLHHFKAIMKATFDLKLYSLNEGLKTEENPQNIEKLNNAIEAINSIDKTLSSQMMEMFLSEEPVDFNSKMQETMNDWDNKMKSNPIFDLKEIFKDNEQQKRHYYNLFLSFKKYSNNISNISLKQKNGVLWNDLNHNEQKGIKTYNNLKNKATIDTISYDEINGKITPKNAYEIKNLSTKNGMVDFNIHFKNSVKKSSDFSNILENNNEYLVSNQETVTEHERIRLDPLMDFGFESDNIFMAVNLFNEMTQTVSRFEIPLYAWKEFFINKKLFDNALITQRGEYKFKLSIEKEFFEETFSEYRINKPQKEEQAQTKNMH